MCVLRKLDKEVVLGFGGFLKRCNRILVSLKLMHRLKLIGWNASAVCVLGRMGMSCFNSRVKMRLICNRRRNGVVVPSMLEGKHG